MTKETGNPESKVTKKGAVELEEKDLDDVTGGMNIGIQTPNDHLQPLNSKDNKLGSSLTEHKIGSLAQKVSPTIGKTTPNR